MQLHLSLSDMLDGSQVNKCLRFRQQRSFYNWTDVGVDGRSSLIIQLVSLVS